MEKRTPGKANPPGALVVQPTRIRQVKVPGKSGVKLALAIKRKSDTYLIGRTPSGRTFNLHSQGAGFSVHFPKDVVDETCTVMNGEFGEVKVGEAINVFSPRADISRAASIYIVYRSFRSLKVGKSSAILCFFVYSPTKEQMGN